MKKVRLFKRLAFVAAFTVLTAMVWISLDSYRQLTSKDRVAEVESLTRSLNPELKLEILDLIEQKKEFSVEDVSQYLVPSPTPTPTEALRPTPTPVVLDLTPTSEPAVSGSPTITPALTGMPTEAVN